MALLPAELAKQGAQRGQSEADAALLSRTCRSSASSATTTSGPTSRRAALLATSTSLAVAAICPAFLFVRVFAATPPRGRMCP